MLRQKISQKNFIGVRRYLKDLLHAVVYTSSQIFGILPWKKCTIFFLKQVKRNSNLKNLLWKNKHSSPHILIRNINPDFFFYKTYTFYRKMYVFWNLLYPTSLSCAHSRELDIWPKFHSKNLIKSSFTRMWKPKQELDVTCS